MDPNINFTDKSTPDELRFDLENVDVSLANSIRRIMISEIPTVAFDTIDYENSSLKVIHNSGALHNEMLVHRLGMIPINIEDPLLYDPTDYKFILDVQNTKNTMLDVTSKDIKVIDNKTNGEIDSEEFFPANPITGDHILITRLKPNPGGGEGERIHIEGTAVKGIGKENSRWSPCSCVTYIYKKDESKFQEAVTHHVTTLSQKKDEAFTPEQEADIINTFRINEEERYFYTDESNNPNIFEFYIESVGVLKAHSILSQAFDVLVKKIGNFKTNFDGHVRGEETSVKVMESPTVMSAFDIIIDEEDHTLGFLLQSYIERLVPEVKFVGYNNPHPLKKNIVLRISTSKNDMDDIKSVIATVCKGLIDICRSLQDIVKKEFAGK